MYTETASTEPCWQAVAIELIRRRTGASPRVSTAELAHAGRRHEAVLFRKHLDSLYFVTCEIDHPRQRLYQALWDIQVAEASDVIAELAELEATPIAFKGLEIGTRYDRGRAIGLRGDVDLLMPRDALWTVRHVLSRRGYVQGAYRPETRDWGYMDPIAAAQWEASHYELLPFVKAIPIAKLDDAARAEGKRFNEICVHDDVTLALAAFDIHHNVFANFDPSHLMMRSVPGAIGVGRALCVADHLWFTIHRHYTEVAMGIESTLRILAAIAPMVSDPTMDWDILIHNAVEQRSTSACFYWLSFFHKLAPATVPASVLTRLRSRNRATERDWGWQLGRLFEIEEPFPDQLMTG